MFNHCLSQIEKAIAETEAMAVAATLTEEFGSFLTRQETLVSTLSRLKVPSQNEVTTHAALSSLPSVHDPHDSAGLEHLELM